MWRNSRLDFVVWQRFVPMPALWDRTWYSRSSQGEFNSLTFLLSVDGALTYTLLAVARHLTAWQHLVEAREVMIMRQANRCP